MDLQKARGTPGATIEASPERTDALDRFRALRPHLEDGVPLARAAREAGVPIHTAQRWLARYRADGFAGLADRPRPSRGRPRGLPEAFVRLVEGLALGRPRPSAAAIHRRAAEVAAREGWPEPGYHQVYRIVRRLDPALLTLAHQGEEAYRRRYDLVLRREAGEPNEVWQADHTQLDVWVLDERGKSARPWLTAILDDRSRAVPGYYLSLAAPSAQGTALALHQAIRTKGDPLWPVCGIPGAFYTDHGSDFTSRRIEQVAVDLRMRLVFSLPGQPRGRGKIERFFGTVNELFLSTLPGYSPPGGPRAEPALALADLDARFRAWLVGEYHRRAHGETGQTPIERWEAGGFLPRLPDSAEQLDLLLLTVARLRRVQRDGIRFQCFRYTDATLAAFVGEDVLIRYDPRDLAEIRVYHRGAFLCRAVAQELAGRTVGIREIARARDERRRRLKATLSNRTTLVDAVLGLQAGALPPEEPPPDPPKPRLKRYVNE